MTGYGSAQTVTEAYTLKAEIKALNSKFLDLMTRLPKEFNDKELEIKSLIGQRLSRGKISFNFEFQTNEVTDLPVKIDESLFSLYYDQFELLANGKEIEPAELFKLAVHSPNVIIPKDDLGDIIPWEEVKKIVETAIDTCDSFRISEGQQLEKSLRNNIQKIGAGLEKVTEMDPNRVKNMRKRLDNIIADLRERFQADENRFEQELIYYMEKLDISEEKVRLKSHLDYFLEVIESADSNGKKLGFIAQEIGREINTIGSKANDADIQREVVLMKDELEQIKEQVLNVM